MFKGVLRTREAMAPLVARLALGVVIFPHGAQKVLGVWGGKGLQETIAGFEGMGIPPALAWCAVAAEFLGSLGLIFGFLTRICALGIATVMVVAAVKVHAAHGFFMNWHGGQAGEGFEYHVLAAGLALSLFLSGGGALSLDRKIVGGDTVPKPR
jgi:putative oxidoreductase